MRDWWKILILLLLILFVLYRGCSRCGLRKVFEGMEPNTEMITNGNFMLPLVPLSKITPLQSPPATGTSGNKNISETSLNPANVATTMDISGNIKIPQEILGKIAGGTGTTLDDPYRIGWKHGTDISLCVGAFLGIKSLSKQQYILIDKPNAAIEQSVAISDKGIYDITINATGTNPISVYLKTGLSGDVSQNIYNFTPTADWSNYTKRFTISADSRAETIAIIGTGTGITGISNVSLKMPAIADPNDKVKKAITDMSNNVIRKMTEMTTREDTKFAEMLAAINNMKISANQVIDNNVNKYKGF